MTRKVTEAERRVFVFIHRSLQDRQHIPTPADIDTGLPKLSDNERARALKGMERDGHIRVPGDRNQPLEILGSWRDPNVTVSGRFKMFQGVIALRNLDEHDNVGLREPITSGTMGVVVEIFAPDGLAIEFFDGLGNTIDVAFLPESYVRPETPEEVEARRGAQAARTT